MWVVTWTEGTVTLRSIMADWRSAVTFATVDVAGRWSSKARVVSAGTWWKENR
jgi:hypothetical protein